MVIDKFNYLTDVPIEFSQLAKHPFPYPKDNFNVFEEYFHQVYDVNAYSEVRNYLPIYWTGYYIRADYGNNKKKIDRLQHYLNTLDKSKKYYTIVQYDDGILNDLADLDIQVFSMSSKNDEYPLPLICPLHKFSFDGLKDIRVSFIGKITHRIRQLMMDSIPHQARSKVWNKNYWLVDTVNLNLKDYCEIISRSIFTLCPRGYGPNSFRVMESLQYESIPVYIGDSNKFAHNINFEEYGIIIQESDIHKLFEILSSIGPNEIVKKRERGKEIFQDYYTYEANRKLILDNLQ